ESLARCQFKFPPEDKAWVPHDLEDFVRNEGIVAQTMAMLALGIVGHRLKRQLYILRGWPGRLALFLGGANSAAQAMQCWQADVAAYAIFKDNANFTAGCKTFVERCLFKDVANEQIMEILRAEAGQVTPKFLAWVRESFDGPLNSKVVEDCIKALSDMADGQGNMKVSARKSFSHLIDSQVLDGIHRWKSVDSDLHYVYERQQASTAKWYQPSAAGTTVPDAKDVATYASSVKWYSPGAQNISQQATDLELMRFCQGDLRQCRSAWVCVFLRAKNQAVPIQWLSPVEQRLRYKHVESKDFKGWHVRPYQVGDVDSFEKVASRAAWWNYDQAVLGKVADHLGMPSTGKPKSLYNILFDLIQFCLGTSDRDTLELCKHRFATSELDDILMMELILDSEEGFEMIDASDRKAYAEERDKVVRKRAAHAQFIKDWQEGRNKIVGEVPSPVNVNATKAKQKAARARGERIYPAVLPTKDITQPELKAMAPPGGYIWTGNKVGNFSAHFKPWPRVSKSWALHGGATKAGYECLRYLWDRWCLANGKSHSDVPIRGLFPADGQSAGAG
ncbi:unnamed protein product, partial [Prorocentrum cordatum]